MRHYHRTTPRQPKGSPDDPVRPGQPQPLPAGTELEPAAFEWRGQRVEIRLRQPGWQARSDQVAALIGGEWVLMSKRAVAVKLSQMALRTTPRKVLRGM